MSLPIPSFFQSLGLKLFIIVILSVVLMVPLVIVWGLVVERAQRRDTVADEIGAVWGREQSAGAIALTVPFETLSTAANATTRVPRRAIVLPETLTIEAQLAPEVRYRSIFAVNLYRATLRVSGTFRMPDIARLGATPDVVFWPQAVLDVGIRDLRGVVSASAVSWGATSVGLEPSAEDGPFGPGLRALAPAPPIGTIPFSFEIVLAGTEALMFLPSGANTNVTLASTWPSPGFSGGLLPLTRDVRTDGFTAEWRSNYLSRPFPQAWLDGTMERSALSTKTTDASFGVTLVTTVDHYQQVERAAKYGGLFIVLTFGVFFVWEVVERLRVHPVQYLLVGLALIVFYLLLLSLSEQITFGLAYTIAAAATVLLVGSYAATMLGAGRRGLAVGVWVSVLYGVLFVLLRLEDLALLVGAVVVFLSLAAVMYATRRVDWYGAREAGSGPR
jgi:inner membrane protein